MEHFYARELVEMFIQIPPVVQLLPSEAILIRTFFITPGAYLDNAGAVKTVQVIFPTGIEKQESQCPQCQAVRVTLEGRS